MKKQLAQLANAPIHITYEMFLSIMTARLKVALSDNELKAAFKLLDVDGSGSLEVDEFREVLRNLGDQFTDDEIEEMISQADKDGNGSIEENEFLLVMRRKASQLDTGQNSNLLNTLQ